MPQHDLISAKLFDEADVALILENARVLIRECGSAEDHVSIERIMDAVLDSIRQNVDCIIEDLQGIGA